MPILVGLIPTLRTVTSEFGHIRAATIKYAAEDMSAGTEISFAVSYSTGFNVIVFPSVFMSAPR